MVDWTKPVETDLYLEVLQALKDRDAAGITWLDSSLPAVPNLPAGAKRWNETAKKWEKFSGTIWSDLADLFDINVKKLNGKELSAFVLGAEKGAANGVAPLGANSRIAAAFIGSIDYGNNPASAFSLQLKRLTALQLASYIGVVSELVLNTTSKQLHIMDGVTPGGAPIVSGSGDGSFTNLTVTNTAQINTTFLVGVSGAFLKANNAGLSLGLADPDNAENWTRYLHVYGSASARLALQTAGMYAGFWLSAAHPNAAPAGLNIGMKTNHPVSITTNNIRRLTVNSDGSLRVYNNGRGLIWFNDAETVGLHFTDVATDQLNLLGNAQLKSIQYDAFYALAKQRYAYTSSLPDFGRFTYLLKTPLASVTTGTPAPTALAEANTGGGSQFNYQSGLITFASDFNITGKMYWYMSSLSELPAYALFRTLRCVCTLAYTQPTGEGDTTTSEYDVPMDITLIPGECVGIDLNTGVITGYSTSGGRQNILLAFRLTRTRDAETTPMNSPQYEEKVWVNHLWKPFDLIKAYAWAEGQQVTYKFHAQVVPATQSIRKV